MKTKTFIYSLWRPGGCKKIPGGENREYLSGDLEISSADIVNFCKKAFKKSCNFAGLFCY